VVSINYTIAICISETDISRSKNTTSKPILHIVLIDLSLCLEYTVMDISVEITDRISGNSPRRRVCDLVAVSGEFFDHILYGRDITSEGQRPIVVYALVPPCRGFDTFIFDITDVAQSGDRPKHTGYPNHYAVGVFVIIDGFYIQSVLEGGQLKARFPTLHDFPMQIGIGY